MSGFLAAFLSPLINDAAHLTAQTAFRIPVARWLAEAGKSGDSGSRSWAVEVAQRQG